jgi:hypothetical protein
MGLRRRAFVTSESGGPSRSHGEFSVEGDSVTLRCEMERLIIECARASFLFFS